MALTITPHTRPPTPSTSLHPPSPVPLSCPAVDPEGPPLPAPAPPLSKWGTATASATAKATAEEMTEGGQEAGGDGGGHANYMLCEKYGEAPVVVGRQAPGPSAFQLCCLWQRHCEKLFAGCCLLGRHPPNSVGSGGACTSSTEANPSGPPGRGTSNSAARAFVSDVSQP